MSHAPTATLTRRHNAIRADLAPRRLDALVVTSLPNVLYLTNFTGSTAIAVLTASRLLFLTDSRYVTVVGDTQATSHACPTFELVRVDGSYDAKLVDVIASLGGLRIGFEAADITVSRHTWLTRTLA